jgi:release factor glutamine methyltransferase
MPLYDEREARAVVRYLLEEEFHLSLTDIYCGGLDRLTDVQRRQLESCMVRLEEGEPVQYVVGTAWFCGHPFHVEPGVLIPRPETEELVRHVAFWLNALPRSLRARRVLDVGTGSGCIAISLAMLCHNTKVDAWDISDVALRIARDNAARLDRGSEQVTFIKQDALNPPDDMERYDAMVSNPPYVRESERRDMAANVTGHEPSLALFVPDDDPLLFYANITRYATQALKHGGLLAFEVNSAFAQQVKMLLEDNALEHTAVLTDLYGRPRIVKGTKP